MKIQVARLHLLILFHSPTQIIILLKRRFYLLIKKVFSAR